MLLKYIFNRYLEFKFLYILQYPNDDNNIVVITIAE